MRQGWMVEAILLALREQGPMTRVEIQTAIGMTHDQLGSTMDRLTHKTKRLPKRVHIADWVYDGPNNSRYYPRAVFAIGDLGNKRRPKRLTPAENSKRHRDRAKMRGVRSIFDMALNTASRIKQAVSTGYRAGSLRQSARPTPPCFETLNS